MCIRDRRHFVRPLEIVLFEFELDRVNQYLQILFDFFLLRRPGRGLEFRKHNLGLLPLLIFVDQRGL